jgi:fructose-specific phosphotransferase system IIA component
MKISDILTEEVIATHLPGNTKEEVLDNIIELAAHSPNMKNKEKVRAAILERERIMSTGVGRGVAVPHGKCDGVSDTVTAFAVTDKPVDFKSLDGQPVQLMFLLVGRENSVGAHLKLLSRISRLMSSDGFRNKLIAANTPAEVIELFRKEEEQYFEN